MKSRRSLGGASNPQAIHGLIPYSTYHQHKTTRQQVSAQRQQAQHTISFLERQAKRSMRELESRQKSLANYYHLRESRFEDMKKKMEWRRQKQEQLQQQRRTNTISRNTSTARRNQMRAQWEQSNRSSASSIKRLHTEEEQRMTDVKKLELSLLKKRNQNNSRGLSQGKLDANVRSTYSKSFRASQVKNDLIRVQERIKERDLKTIDFLTTRQRSLLEIVEKSKKQSKQCSETMNEFQNMSFEAMEGRAVRTGRRRASSSRVQVAF